MAVGYVLSAVERQDVQEAHRAERARVHAQEGARGQTQQQTHPQPPSGTATLYDYAAIDAEMRVRKGCYITPFTTPLQFFYKPESRIYSAMPDWVAAEPNTGTCRLRDHRNNKRFLENELRLHHLHLMISGWPEDARKVPTLDAIALEIIGADNEKKEHWNQQSLQKRKKQNVVLNGELGYL